MNITLEEGLPVRLGFIELDELNFMRSGGGHTGLTCQAALIRQRFKGLSAGEIDEVQHARKLFRAIHIDPTKRRPSSEALLRRALSGRNMPAVNNLVDTANWCSLEFLLPVCVYDAGSISGKITLRIGKKDEHYLALNHQDIEFEGRYCFADDTGPFGSPMTDSVRTAVTCDTTHGLFILFSSTQFHADSLKHALDVSEKRLVEECGGNILHKGIIH